MFDETKHDEVNQHSEDESMPPFVCGNAQKFLTDKPAAAGGAQYQYKNCPRKRRQLVFQYAKTQFQGKS